MGDIRNDSRSQREERNFQFGEIGAAAPVESDHHNFHAIMQSTFNLLFRKDKYNDPYLACLILRCKGPDIN